MSEWINCDDKMPHDEQHVLIFEPHCLSHAERGIGDTIYFNGLFDDYRENGSRWVTHWMPLPEPPDGR